MFKKLFLDADGTKISKSKGNGLSMEEWLQYAPEESLAYFMYQSPRKAKRLYFDVIPRAVDEYLSFLEKFPEQPLDQKLSNPVWHVHNGKPPREELPLTFGILLNLASVTNTEDKKVLWGFISRYAKGATPESMPMVDHLVGYAIAYYRDFVKPHKHYRMPTVEERKALEDLDLALKHVEPTPEAIQEQVFEVGKRHNYANLRDWFKALYQILLGQDEGPRMGSFIALYGIQETTQLIEDALKKNE